jgi:hypothetical protein
LDEKNPKIKQSKEVFGKPHVFVKGKRTTAYGDAVMHDLIDKHERDNQEGQIEKYYARIRKEESVNEYNKTQIE